MIEYFESACMPVFAIMHTVTNGYHYWRALQIANSNYCIRYTAYSVFDIHPNAQNSKRHKCKLSAWRSHDLLFDAIFFSFSFLFRCTLRPCNKLHIYQWIISRTLSLNTYIIRGALKYIQFTNLYSVATNLHRTSESGQFLFAIIQ